MNILFHSNQLGLRGTEVHMFELAKECQERGDKCYIAALENKANEALEKFREQFPVILYNDFNQVEEEIKHLGVDWLYAIKGGKNDNVVSKFCKNFIHVVFQRYDKHGDKYVFISKWLADKFHHSSELDYLPFVVTLPNIPGNMREELGIPENAIVLGRTGGFDEFNIPFVYQAIADILNYRKDIYFLFLSTREFIKHKNVIHIPSSWDRAYTRRFINTCDYMLHARVNGESFGLAIAEFLYCNKPVITWSDGIDKNHVEMCGDTGIYYNDYPSLYRIFLDLEKPGHLIDVTNKVTEYSPTKVVSKFKKILETK